jgi:hypothetical protein
MILIITREPIDHNGIPVLLLLIKRRFIEYGIVIDVTTDGSTGQAG